MMKRMRERDRQRRTPQMSFSTTPNNYNNTRTLCTYGFLWYYSKLLGQHTPSGSHRGTSHPSSHWGNRMKSMQGILGPQGSVWGEGWREGVGWNEGCLTIQNWPQYITMHYITPHNSTSHCNTVHYITPEHTHIRISSHLHPKGTPTWCICKLCPLTLQQPHRMLGSYRVLYRRK
jgi:hypothetical protein